MNIDDMERLARSPFVTGALGGLVTALRFMPGASWAERAVNVGAGSLTAGYLSPALVQFLQLHEGYAYGAAFVVGMLGLSVVAAVMQGLRELKLAEILTGWLSRRG